MSKDIRSFFKVQSAKAAPVSAPITTKRKALFISSDEDDEPPKNDKNKKSKTISPKSSKHNEDRATKPNIGKLKQSTKISPKKKLVNAADMFGTEPIKRIEKPKVDISKKVPTPMETFADFDDDFDVSVLDDIDNDIKMALPQKEEIDKSNYATSTSTKLEPSRTVTTQDEDREEKKRLAAILYQKYKNRSSGPLNPGCKEIPNGKPNCLSGLTFVLTGVYESLDRNEADELIKKYGGKVTTSLSKKTSYLVAGEDAGLTKLAKAEEFKLPVLSENDLLALIKTKSGNWTEKLEAGVDCKENGELEKTKAIVSASIKKDTLPANQSNKDSAQKCIKIEKSEQRTKTNEAIPIAGTVSCSAGTGAISADCQAWVEKYKPTSTKQIIGQQGAASNCVKLINWLSKWYINRSNKKLQKPSPWAKNDDGSFFKAVLLSGPPGVGKTTTASLVCKELGFDIVEFNASDTRSKRLLKEEVAGLLSNQSLFGYCHGSSEAISSKHVLIMDEVDGMAGNEDRGGIQELISLIKDASVPIICMCNDRNHQKMRSLVNYCFDLRFNRPRLEQIKGAMSSICFREKLKISPSEIEEVISATNNDIRQTLNHLTLLSANKNIPLQQGDDGKHNTAKKDMKIGPWDVVRKVFSVEEHKNMTMTEKADLFFNDYSLGPLFVQQNYLIVAPKVARSDVLKHVALAADSLSLGDLVENRIRSKMAWSMLPIQAMYSSVLPGEYMAGHITKQINFPAWLGKFSKANKRKRLAQEIHDHTRIRTSGSRLSVRLDYASFLLDKIVQPLKAKGLDGVQEALQVLKEYHLLREDIDSLIELTTWPGQKNKFESVDSKVKAALTRAYNKEVSPYTYSLSAAIKKKKTEASMNEFDEFGQLDDETNPDIGSDEEEDNNLENDVLIKAKKKAPSKADSKPKEKAKPSARGKAKSKKAL